MAESTDYKTLKEAFVSGQTGSSMGHVNMISLVSLMSIALHSALRTRLPSQKNLNFAIDFVLLAVPMLLSVTTFAMSPGYLLVLLMLPTLVLLLLPAREAGTPLPSMHASGNAQPKANSVIPPLAALTTYRAYMLLFTSICILAVDFPVFPRALAKCESFGASLMDIGVGSFVFSQGIVSAIPLIKDRAYLRAAPLTKILAVTQKCLPVIALGLLRTLSVKGTEYPEHETEYGTHWNFFITIGMVPILQVMLHPFMIYLPVSLLGVIVAVAHQISLSSMGLMDYVLHAPRTSLVSANKEGLVSVTGYLALHLLGLSTGTILLPSSPSYFRRMQHELRDDDTPSKRSRGRIQDRRENDKTATELFAYAVLWWAALGAVRLLGVGQGISRRVVNMPYILWVAAFNTSFLLGYLLLDLVFFSSPLSRSVYSPTSKLKVQPDPVLLGYGRRDGRGSDGTPGAPALLEAINRNGLVFFLLANVATGLINMTVSTMFMPDWWAMAILFCYTLAVCFAAWATRRRRLCRF
ncbi:hypothetical protein PHLGIDRAFT_111619 [Phlebiopsis gigantea 11061_1 CR5-6]|uniref:GPI-anchored wall transfer protein n=1 Tax=Phlebiopsis gigantea (strain 11061_1 CR5-6) TaxID=745531 RepID=A0A0C3S121_PHLG1|nr:hypothetical protein PHLGIDRAFT_111619 [Phlebiopsis gigantea 11061_1 CR5-6]